MNDKVEHDDQNVEQVANTLVARRRFIRNLAIAAGVGTLAVAAPGKAKANTTCPGEYICTAYVCAGSYVCGVGFGCPSNFLCAGGPFACPNSFSD
jgi:hypothetical protein